MLGKLHTDIVAVYKDLIFYNQPIIHLEVWTVDWENSVNNLQYDGLFD